MAQPATESAHALLANGAVHAEFAARVDPLPQRTRADARHVGAADSTDLDYLRTSSSDTPYSPLAAAMPERTRVPTPLSVTPTDNQYAPVAGPSSKQGSPPADSPVSPPLPSGYMHPLSRLSDDSNSPEPSPTLPFARPPKMPHSVDPNQFPDPYPFRSAPHFLNSTAPSLSSADSSTASTRSSAYTSFGSALAQGDFVHVHSASDENELGVPAGIMAERMLPLKTQNSTRSLPSSSSTRQVSTSEPLRWSASYASNVEALINSQSQDEGAQSLPHRPSFDASWDAVDEGDEAGLITEDETDDDLLIGDTDDEQEDDDRTAAVVIAEEGRGLIVRGESLPIAKIQVQPGTTHLLVGSSSTPNAVPSFLATHLPQISHSLLALDISANFLGALPPALVSCTNLEELNIASNPLRALPIFLSQLTSLRVLIADSTGITALPNALSALDKLHTLSVRRNKLSSLASWLCLLPSLQMLLIDGNPFQGPWKALVEPILAKEGLTPMFSPATPSSAFPMSATSTTGFPTGQTSDGDDDLHDSPSTASRENSAHPDDEDTIMPVRAPALGRSVTSPVIMEGGEDSASLGNSLARRKTTPNRMMYERARSASKSKGSPAPTPTPKRAENTEQQVRRMKSAGELRREFEPVTPPLPSAPISSTPTRPVLTHYATSASGSSSNLYSPTSPSRTSPGETLNPPKRFASLGITSGSRTPSSPGMTRSFQRQPVDQSIWDNISESGDEDPSPLNSPKALPASPVARDYGPSSGGRDGKADKDRDKDKSKWGFLKKMSMAKMRLDTAPAPRPSSHARPPSSTRSLRRPHTAVGNTTPSPTLPQINEPAPKLDIRFSAIGPLEGLAPPAAMSKKASRDNLKLAPSPLPLLSPSQPQSSTSPPSSSLLVPTTQTSRAMKRRSFLPLDAPQMALTIPIPPPSPSMDSVVATNGAEERDGTRTPSPSPTENAELHQRREEERQREAYARSMRSVMAYLRDMHDLGLSQTAAQVQNPTSPSNVELVNANPRSRRPTMVDVGGRTASEMSVASDISTVSMALSSSTSTSQLRSMRSISDLRSGTMSQTLSVATTDSNGSSGSHERKFKDDKAKRRMICREIVETERTYVKGLQELVDIYIKPASASVTVLSGVSSKQELVVPPSEQKVVFGGVESLFSFHKESFLPALENAAAPLMKPATSDDVDPDGQLSIMVATAVANMFVSHAAFMKMYSTYINNFDNSVQRIKSWTSDRIGNSSPGGPPSASSSTAQLVGLGLTMSAVSTPGFATEGTSGPVHSRLSSGQRKRIKTWLKRCRINPRHSQLNLEGYLLLPVQRIPRYRLLLEELVRSTPPTYGGYIEDPLDRALAEIASLATNMNEGKRESESRRKLVQWQARIRGKFPSPLVQPHRRLIMDGSLRLTRVVRKTSVAYETFNAQGDGSTVQVECLAPEMTPRALIGVLCNDLLVLCRDPTEGRDPTSPVDLWAVLRMQTVPQPASIVHGNVLRIVDNKAVLYFEAPSASDALNWYRAINIHIPASKT